MLNGSIGHPCTHGDQAFNGAWMIKTKFGAGCQNLSLKKGNNLGTDGMVKISKIEQNWSK